MATDDTGVAEPVDAGAEEILRERAKGWTPPPPEDEPEPRPPRKPSVSPRLSELAFARMEKDGHTARDNDETRVKHAKYTAEQESLELANAGRRQRRGDSLVPVVLRWLSAKIKVMHDQMVDNNRNTCEAIAIVVYGFADWWLRSVPRFLWAHAGGWVGKARRAERATPCGNCTYRREVHGHEVCSARREAKSCDCPESRLWPPGWLPYMRALGNASCPLDRWGRRWTWTAILVWLLPPGLVLLLLWWAW